MRPNATGFTKDRTSVNILMLPLSVRVNSSRSATTKTILGQSSVECLGELEGGTGFREKPEDVSVIDSEQSGLLVGVSGEHHTDGLRGDMPDPGQQFDAVHAWHAHVGNDHRIGALCLNRRQRLFAAFRDIQVIRVQDSLVSPQDVWLVINNQDLLTHNETPSGYVSRQMLPPLVPIADRILFDSGNAWSMGKRSCSHGPSSRAWAACKMVKGLNCWLGQSAGAR